MSAQLARALKQDLATGLEPLFGQFRVASAEKVEDGDDTP